MLAVWMLPPGIIASGALLAQEVADKLPVYSITGGVLMLAMFLIRRWTKQIDDASIAAAKARAEKDVEIAALKEQHQAEMQEVRSDLARFRRAFSRVLNVLGQIEAISDEDRVKLAQLRSEGLETLFDQTPPRGQPRAD